MSFKADIHPTIESPPRLWSEWIVRQFRRLSQWTVNTEAAIANISPEVISYGASITDDAGDGTTHGDLNATDFTGHPYADPDTPSALLILSNSVVSFGHKAVAYKWIGPSSVSVGVGGSHTAVANNLVPIGTADHNLLVNRTAVDQHPTSAITNLDSDQAAQDANISTNASNLTLHVNNTSNPHQVNHSQLPDVDPDPGDPHSQYQLKLPSMVLAGTADSFTLDTTDSKLVNYTVAAEGNTSGSIDATNGEITIPSDGVYQLLANVLGLQGNDTKEEWIELRLDVSVVAPERYVIGFADVTTDKTSTRQVISAGTRHFTSGMVLSLYMWASEDLGTFLVSGVSFELHKMAES